MKMYVLILLVKMVLNEKKREKWVFFSCNVLKENGDSWFTIAINISFNQILLVKAFS